MPTAIGTILTMLSEVVETVVGFIAIIVVAVVAQPILLIPVGIGLLFTGVALVKSFLR